MASNPTTSPPSTDTLIFSNLLLFIDKLDDSNYHTWAFDTSLWIIRLGYKSHITVYVDSGPEVQYA